MRDHDKLHHRLFDHPGMVAQLLHEFVAGPWLDDLDLEGMERLNARFHAETGKRREGDMVWRIPRRDGSDTYLVLLLEFQSTPDPWMALRVLVYASLLWQQLVDEKRLPPDGRLPPDPAGRLVQRRPSLGGTAGAARPRRAAREFAIVAMATGDELPNSRRRRFPRG